MIQTSKDTSRKPKPPTERRNQKIPHSVELERLQGKPSAPQRIHWENEFITGLWDNGSEFYRAGVGTGSASATLTVRPHRPPRSNACAPSTPYLLSGVGSGVVFSGKIFAAGVAAGFSLPQTPYFPGEHLKYWTSESDLRVFVQLHCPRKAVWRYLTR